MGQMQAISMDALLKMVVQLSMSHFDYMVLLAEGMKEPNTLLDPNVIKRLANCTTDQDFIAMARATISRLTDPHLRKGSYINTINDMHIII